MNSRKAIIVLGLTLCLTLVTLLPVPIASGYYSPHSGDHFSYHEVETVGNGTGTYSGYTDQTIVNGAEMIDSVSGPIVTVDYGYNYSYSSNQGSTQSGAESGAYTFSSSTFLYVNGTDDQTGYTNPTVWFYMNSSIPKGGTFSLLNTQMTVVSRNYSYLLPSENEYVVTIFTQGVSNYLRDDSYGVFNAKYTWDSYFDPSTGYIVGYSYVEQDTNSSGSGFTYTDTLYVTGTSYPLTAAPATVSSGSSAPGVSSSSSQSVAVMPPATIGLSQDLPYIAGGVIIVVVLIAVIAYALSRRGRAASIPRHSYNEGGAPPAVPPPSIDLTPKEQPPVQQIVIKEVAKVKCQYCGALIDSTATVCPQCGAPRT